MKQRLIKLLLNFLFVGLFVWLYATTPGVVHQVSQFGIGVAVFALVYQAVSMWLSAVIFNVVFRSMGRQLSISDGYYSAFLSSFGNYFLPLSAGLVLRARFFKQTHNFSYKDFSAITYGSYILSFLLNAVIGLVAMGMLALEGKAIPWSLLILLVGVLVFSISLTSHFMRLDELTLWLMAKFKPLRGFAGKIQKIVDGWKVVMKQPGLMVWLIGLMLATIITRVVFMLVAFHAVGVGIDIPAALIFTVLLSLATYLTITPASLGIREALFVFYASTLGLSKSAILSVNLLERASLLILLTGLFIFFQFVQKRDMGSLLKLPTKDN